VEALLAPPPRLLLDLEDVGGGDRGGGGTFICGKYDKRIPLRYKGKKNRKTFQFYYYCTIKYRRNVYFYGKLLFLSSVFCLFC
jgi:hypothetical protein